MSDLSSRAAELVAPLVMEKNIRFRVECSEDKPTAVCDADKIIQVITNLLGNAIKFTPTGNGITLKATVINEGTPHVEVSVQDEGIGIPEGEEAMIFESFRQSSRTNTGAGGTGLGLAICRRIVEAHAGKIWAENMPGGGAKVTFRIPANLQEGKRTVQLIGEATGEAA
jgi:signal transduction histidine kinase